MKASNAEIRHNNELSRLIYFDCQLYDGNDERNPYDAGIRMIYIIAESVASALLYGHLDQDGGFVIDSATVDVAGMSALGSEEGAIAIVTEGHRLLDEYLQACLAENVGITRRDALALNHLLVNPIPYPFGGPVDTPTPFN